MYHKIIPSPLTLQSLIKYSVKNFASQPAVSFVDGKPILYNELDKEIKRIALLLYSYGLTPGDKVALFSQNMPNWVVAYFAVVSNGLIIVPILPDFTAEETENVLIHSEAKAIFISEKLYPKLAGKTFPDLILTIITDNFNVINTSVKQLDVKLPNIKVKESDIAAIIYTSGTTGRSKGVVLTHANITFVAMQSYAVFPIHQHDVFLSFLPLSHTYENSIGMLYPIMYGASIYYLEKAPTSATLLPALAKIKPTMMLSVPLIMEKLYKNQVLNKFSKNKFSRIIYKTPILRILIHNIAGKKLFKTFGGRLKFFGIGGAKLDARVERFLKEAKFPYAIGYGLTETAPLLAGASPNQTKLHSTGFAMEGVQLKINDPDKKGIGEIWAKGPNVMTGYYKNPEATTEVISEDGWFKTGDLGKLDKQNRLFIKGRMKNTILRASGENVYPEDIESVINNTQIVTESLVIEEEGFLVAKILLDIETIEKNYEHLKQAIEEGKEKYNEWRANFTKELNSKLNRASQINRIDIMDKPFEKTASQKIKRFLYIRNKSK
jgi:long-chain acyl-CoA synthetase